MIALSPNDIPEMLEAIDSADVAAESRFVPGGKLDKRWEANRQLASWWANGVYTRLISGLSVKDATSGFTCWRANSLRKIDLDAVVSNGYSFQFEMAFLADKLGFRVVNIPIYFEDRRIGESKLRIGTKLEAALRA